MERKIGEDVIWKKEKGRDYQRYGKKVNRRPVYKQCKSESEMGERNQSK